MLHGSQTLELSPGPDPARLLGSAFDGGGEPRHDGGAYRMRWVDGTSTTLRPARWLAPPGPEELELLDGVVGPVLDVGCGPGRHVAALVRREITALGIDVLPAAVRAGRRRGAEVELRSVFDPELEPGRWATALLLDGNVGIGGDPVALLRRVAELLRPGGRAFAELEEVGVGLRTQHGRLETPDGLSAPFAWGRVGADAANELAAAAGFAVGALWCRRGRWFARLELL